MTSRRKVLFWYGCSFGVLLCAILLQYLDRIGNLKLCAEAQLERAMGVAPFAVVAPAIRGYIWTRYLLAVAKHSFVNNFGMAENDEAAAIPQEMRKPIRIVGAGVKTGKVLSLKLAIDIGCHYRLRPIMFDYQPFIAQPGTIQTVSAKQYEVSVSGNDASDATTSSAAEDRNEGRDPQQTTTHCVWIARNPLSTLVSFYTYFGNGGEYDLRWVMDGLAELSESANGEEEKLTQGVRYVFDVMARYQMVYDTEWFFQSLAGQDGTACSVVRLEDFATNFEETATRFVLALGLPPSDALLAKLADHNARTPHFSKASAELKKKIRNVICGSAEMREFVAAMQERWNYTSENDDRC